MKLTAVVRGKPVRRPRVVSSMTQRDRSRSAIGPRYSTTGALSSVRRTGLARRRVKVGSELAIGVPGRQADDRLEVRVVLDSTRPRAQLGQCTGSDVIPRKRKSSCSPAEKTKPSPHSRQRRTLSAQCCSFITGSILTNASLEPNCTLVESQKLRAHKRAVCHPERSEPASEVEGSATRGVERLGHGSFAGSG